MGVGQQGQHSSVVRIFLASSAELVEHRREFEIFIGRQNKLGVWKQRAIQFEVALWEDFVDAMSATRLQDEYNKAIASCDVFVMLFRTKVGKYTAEEFEKAFGQFKATGRPLVYTFFHNSSAMLGGIDRSDMQSLWAFQDKLKELQHFQTDYDNHEGLRLSFSQQLLKLDGDGRLVPRDEKQGREADGRAPSAERERELDYLGNLVHRLLGAVDALWVPVEAGQTRARTLERTRRTPIIRGHQSLRRSANVDASARVEPDEHVADVLDAYRALPLRRSVKRLAVLGEPGAGKSFSLQRIAHEYATAARVDPAAPVPLYIQLGDWTDAEPLASFMDHHLAKVCPGLTAGDVQRLRNAGRVVLLLDGLNEIPPREREGKVQEVRIEAEDTRHRGVIVSCRERDFGADCRLPFDELRLEPLEPWQIHDAIVQTMVHDADGDDTAGRERADAMFWGLAGGEDVKQLWSEWQAAGATMRQFWSSDVKDAPTEDLRQCWVDEARQLARDDQRGLLRLASNPYLLTLLMDLQIADGDQPSNRAELFDTCLATLYGREAQARRQRKDDRVPDIDDWKSVLVQLAEALQRADGVDSDAGARTALDRSDWPAGLSEDLVAFSIDASVLQRLGGDTLRFTHQLLQEALAADVLLQAAATQARPASDFWPADRWWRRSGWEVVAEIAAEALAGNSAGQLRLIDWLAKHNPGMAVEIWRHIDRPALPAALLAGSQAQWLPRLTDAQAEQAPRARAAIARWLGAQDLDPRPGTGLRPDGLPDIDWLAIDDDRTWQYQDEPTPPLTPYAIARYPVTHRQWQAFVDNGGYTDDRWWHGLVERPEPKQGRWNEPTSPREALSWFEAVAFCRWLTAQLVDGRIVSLPTEQQWERAARGTDGRTYPWGNEWSSDLANAEGKIARTTLVGLYPNGQSPSGAMDMAGNLSEWCLNEYKVSANTSVAGLARRVVRGGAWGDPSDLCRAGYRSFGAPFVCTYDLGFRVVSCPIQGTVP
jgi:hypothetical protein